MSSYEHNAVYSLDLATLGCEDKQPHHMYEWSMLPINLKLSLDNLSWKLLIGKAISYKTTGP